MNSKLKKKKKEQDWFIGNQKLLLSKSNYQRGESTPWPALSGLLTSCLSWVWTYKAFALSNTEEWTSSGDILVGKLPTPAVWLWCSTNFLCRSARRVATTLVYESGWCSPATLQSLGLWDPLKLEPALPWLLPAFQRWREMWWKGNS